MPFIPLSETNGHGLAKPTNGHGAAHVDSSTAPQGLDHGSETNSSKPRANTFEPIAICGMACRLPGGVKSPKELWNFLLDGRDGRIRIPKTRFNSEGFYSSVKRPGSTNTEYGYFLDDAVDLAGLDTSFFSMSRMEVEWLDPQQRMMLEVARESLDDAGEINYRGSNMGVYVGSFGQDWAELLNRDPLRHNVVSVITSADFMVSERLSHEMDLHGPRYLLYAVAFSFYNHADFSIA
jgi:acyl transferase domain-containing protein